MPQPKFVGKTILIGLTYYEADGTFIEQKQLFGTIRSFDKTNGIDVELDDGSRYQLPPDPSALQPAEPGEYRLRATGKIVIDPDFLTSFTVTKPVKH